MKKALCIHDISCVGRCSLTAISPVISSYGIQCIPMPTAVLSTHFGGFGKPAFVDLTEFCKDSLEHFKSLNLNFDAVYSGYLGNYKQLEIVQDAYNYAKNSLRVCDPVMADNGKIYSSITPELIKGFKQLVKSSDIIIPNPTEAQILLDLDYQKTVFSKEEIFDILNKLKEKFSVSVVITGVKLDSKEMLCLGYDKLKDETFNFNCNYIPVSYPGTGDLFGSLLVSNLLSNESLENSCRKAAKFVEECIKNTHSENSDTRFGVNLEPMLKNII